jgi:cation:H+ antiporter
MIGLAALLTGHVRLRRESLLLEGSVGVLTAVVATGLLLGLLSPVVATLLTAAIIGPYVFLLVRGRRVAAFGFATALAEREQAPPPRPEEKRIGTEALLIVPAVGLIVAGSTGMVEAALSLADHWHASSIAVGVFVLAPLTSIPNAFTALRLGLADRGAALVSETLNSNTINLAAGLIVPALFVTIAAVSREAKFELGWLFLMTVAALLMLARRSGMGRGGGSVLIGLYAAFVVIELIRL